MERPMVIKKELKVSDLIDHNPYILLLLEHLNIPLGLHDKSIEQVCNEQQLNTSLFIVLANLYNGHKPVKVEIDSIDDIESVLKYLDTSHKHYLGEKFPLMTSFINEIVEVNNHQEISLLQKFFEDYYNEVVEHLNYESKVVFPYIMSLYYQIKQGKEVQKPLEYSISEYQGHHDDIEEKLIDLKSLLVKYLPSYHDTVPRRKLLLTLNELEYDLHIHSLIEEAMLIPMVERMELEVNIR